MANPADWENATPVFGIRYPKPNAPAKYLPDMFNHGFTDTEAALLASGQVPPDMAYTTGTSAERQAATPTRNLMWVETDTGNTYIGTGTAWVQVSGGAPPPFTEVQPNGGWVSYTGPAAWRRIDGVVQVRGATFGRTSQVIMNQGQGANIFNGLPVPRNSQPYRGVGFISGASTRYLALLELTLAGNLQIMNMGAGNLTMNPQAALNWSDAAVIPNFFYESV